MKTKAVHNRAELSIEERLKAVHDSMYERNQLTDAARLEYLLSRMQSGFIQLKDRKEIDAAMMSEESTDR